MHFNKNHQGKINNLRLFSCIAIYLTFINLFRFHPDFLPPLAKVFWLDFLILTIIPFVFLLHIRYGIKHSNLCWTIGFIVLAFLSIPSLLSSGADSQQFTYFVRIAFYFFVFLAFFSPWLAHDGESSIKYAKIISYSLLPMLIIVSSQLFSFGIASEFIQSVYGTDKLRSFETLRPRVFGSFYNANWFGVYVMVAMASVLYLFYCKRIGWRVCIFNLSVCSFLLMASGSRTALIGIFIMIWTMILLSIGIKMNYRLISLCFATVTGSIILSILYAGSLQEFILLSRYTELIEASSIVEIGGAHGRIISWEQALSDWSQAPILGPGVTGIPHNSFLTTLLSFGIVGLIVGISFLGWVIYRSLKKRKQTEMIYCLPVLMAFFSMSMTAEFFYTTQVVILILPFLYWSVRKSHKDYKQ